MRIALCLEYPIAQSGGTEVLVTELVKGLGPRHEIVVVSPDTTDSLRHSTAASFVTEHIPWMPLGVTAARARELAARLAAAKVDLAHFHFGGNYAWGNRLLRTCPVIYLRRYGVPCISTNHGAFSILEGYCWHQRSLAVKLALFPSAWLSKQYVLSHLRTEVAVSRHDYHALCRWYPYLRNKFRWIYHSRLHGPPQPVNPVRRKVILCAGTIGHRKGQTYLIEAFGQVAADFPDWEMVLIGRPADEALARHVRALIAKRKLEDRIKLLGRRSDAELTEWLQQSAIFAMPSLHEGLGLSLQEAQFHGCACVASAAGGVVDLVQDGDNGLLVPVAQAGPLARALRRLMSDEALRRRLSIRAPQSVLEKEMTAPQMVEKHERLYSEILAEARGK